MSQQTHRFSSASFEYGTPARFIEAAREVMDGCIDLDPATSPAFNELINARSIFTLADNALRLDRHWYGAVWVNQPYTKRYTLDGTGYPGLHVQFISKLIDQYNIGHVTQACLLINAETAMPWFRPLWKYPRCFVYGRIPFELIIDGQRVPQTRPTHNSAIFYFPAAEDRTDHLMCFEDWFSPLGNVEIPDGWGWR
jgi:hypothetical protein